MLKRLIQYAYKICQSHCWPSSKLRHNLLILLNQAMLCYVAFLFLGTGGSWYAGVTAFVLVCITIDRAMYNLVWLYLNTCLDGHQQIHLCGFQSNLMILLIVYLKTWHTSKFCLCICALTELKR